MSRHMIESHAEMSAKHKSSRSGRSSRSDVPEDPRLKVRPPIEPMEPASKKSKEKSSSEKVTVGKLTAGLRIFQYFSRCRFSVKGKSED